MWLKPVRPERAEMPSRCPQIPSHTLVEWGNCECAQLWAITHSHVTVVEVSKQLCVCVWDHAMFRYIIFAYYLCVFSEMTRPLLTSDIQTTEKSVSLLLSPAHWHRKQRRSLSFTSPSIGGSLCRLFSASTASMKPTVILFKAEWSWRKCRNESKAQTDEVHIFIHKW